MDFWLRCICVLGVLVYKVFVYKVYWCIKCTCMKGVITISVAFLFFDILYT